MPTLDFKGKQYIYAHHLTVPYRPLGPDRAKPVPPSDSPPPPFPLRMTITSLSKATIFTH